MLNTDFKYDFYRKYKRYPVFKDLFSILNDHGLIFLFFMRADSQSPLLNFIKRILFVNLRKKFGFEIDANTAIGSGLYIGHPYNITINPKTVIGKNVNIHKGVTLGQENRGSNKGAPIIGNDVWIGVNVTIVGKVTIGDNVLIAPNAYVNRNIPANSIVFGNPAVIKASLNSTDDYIINRV